MIELNRFTIVIAACVVFFAMFSVNGQKRYVAGLIDKDLVQKIVTREGWSVPAFADEKAEVLADRTELIDDVYIQKTEHKLPEEIIILVEFCESETAKSTEYLPYSMRGYTTYAVEGRVFAYRVQAQILGRYKERFTRIPANIFLTYVDEDGSGKFKLRCPNSTEFGNFPDWVKALEPAPIVRPSKNQ